MTVERWTRDVAGGTDVVHGHAMETALGEQLRCRGEDLVASRTCHGSDGRAEWLMVVNNEPGGFDA
jgi:hypothetical protein